MDREGFRSRWTALHGEVAATGAVRGWLTVSRALASPLARLRIAPSAVTVAALLAAWAAVLPAVAGERWPLVSALLVALSGLLDGLDGPVAVLQDRVSRWGYVLDSVSDRVAEAGFGVSLYVAGAPGWLAAGWVGVGWLQEYLRARAVAAGMTGIEVVTVSERPTRIAVAAMFLLGAGVYPQVGQAWVTVGAAAGLLAGTAGLVQLLVVVRRVVGGSAGS
jgi:CDP-diacylglycerol--glycerol-3-phosphate 3-phosphatidyltransferase